MKLSDVTLKGILAQGSDRQYYKGAVICDMARELLELRIREEQNNWLKASSDDCLLTIKKRLAAAEKVVEAANKCKQDFMAINDGFFSGLVPPEFGPVCAVLEAYDRVNNG